MVDQQKELKLDGKDYISSLPNELLLIILSKLNIVDGARTTILSTRWRRNNLWKLFPSSVLKLDASDFIPCYTHYLRGYHKGYQGAAMNIKFDKILNQIFSRFTGEILDELTISYITCDFKTPVICPRKPWASVDTWIEFAKQKQVKTIDLSFELFKYSERDGSPYKPLPLKSLTSTISLSLVTLRLKFPPELSTSQVQSFLSSFPNLEELSIITDEDHCLMIKLTIEGPFLKLKHLDIIGLPLSFLRISAPNLVSFNYLGSELKFRPEQRLPQVHLDHVPLLSQFSYSEYEYEYKRSSPRLDQLKNSVLKNLAFRDSTSILRFPVAMTNLKQLNLTLGKANDGALNLFFSLLAASPSLCRLSLNLGFVTFSLIPNHKVIAINQCLEEVEIDGFTGFDNEVQLVMLIAQFSPLLRKIMFRPRLSKLSIDHEAYIHTQHHNVVSVVQSLQSRLPRLKLTII